MKPVLRLEGLTKIYGDAAAVDDVNLTLESGQFVTLLGPSGCGKSTTLRMIGGFEAPTRGRIMIDGLDITALPPHRRPVNMVFQDYALFPHLSVAKNVAFGLEMNGTPKRSIAARVDDLLGMMELTDHADKSPHQISGGQKQRVALARALALDPLFLLLDEPLSALDARLRHQMQAELKGLQRRTGKTFILVTHDQAEALSMSDKVVVMNRGRTVQIGTPQDLYMNPVNDFVASFVGEINMMACRLVEARPETLHVDWNGIPLVIRNAERSIPVAARGQRVTAVLRPESIRCSAHQFDHHANSMLARVTQRIFTGAQTSLSLEVAGSAATLTASVTSAEAMALPDEIFIGWSESDLVLVEVPDSQEQRYGQTDISGS